MKQIIYSTGYFETNLTIEPPAEKSDYDFPYKAMAQHKAIIQTPKYELRKTSKCLTKFVIEEGDCLILQKLNTEADKALIDLRNNVITLNECHAICEKYRRFGEMYEKAKCNYTELCKNVWYIEIADETSRGCHALYRFNDGVVSSEQSCKVGEILELKYDPMYSQFSPIKIVTNNG